MNYCMLRVPTKVVKSNYYTNFSGFTSLMSIYGIFDKRENLTLLNLDLFNIA